MVNGWKKKQSFKCLTEAMAGFKVRWKGIEFKFKERKRERRWRENEILKREN